MSPERLYHLEAARLDVQQRKMEELEAARVCVFCLEHVGEHRREPVERVGEHWYVTRNDFPYRGTDEHYLIVAARHVRSFDELPDAAGAELWQHKRWLSERLAPRATATVERSGDMALNGGSVAHLHVHFVAWHGPPSTEVRFRVSGRARDAGA